MLSAFPGRGCRFHVAYACLREERMNPGLTVVWRCRELVKLEKAYDGFLDRAEAFSLGEAKALAIWSKMLGELLAKRPDCEDWAPGEPEGLDEPEAQAGEEGNPDDAAGALVGCRFAYQELCLKRLPVCEGVCPQFEGRVETRGGLKEHKNP